MLHNHEFVAGVDDLFGVLTGKAKHRVFVAQGNRDQCRDGGWMGGSVLNLFIPGFREKSDAPYLEEDSAHSSSHRSQATMRRSLSSLPRLRPASQLLPTLPVLTTRYSSTGPATVVDRGFWKSLVPKPFRKENRQALKTHYGREWNPATFFIVIFLLIGSMSIQMITLRNSFDRYMRVSEIKIGLLREVVERIQNGEKFDVEKALGTGEPEKEADWEEGKIQSKRERVQGRVSLPLVALVLRAIEKDEKPVREQQKKDTPKQPETTAPEPTKATVYTDEQSPSDTIPAKKPAGLGSFF